MQAAIRLILICLFCACLTSAAFPFALVGLSAGPIAWYFRNSIGCLLGECCSQAVSYNQTLFESSLRRAIYGQHIAINRIISHINAHLTDRSPTKPLALSLHGYTGVGKTYVSELIVKHLLKLGSKSRFFRFYDSGFHFSHRAKIDEYKEILQKELVKVVSGCPNSIFVFDEVHQMPTDIVDVLVPFLEIRESVDGADFRRSIFLFLSNAGGHVINQLTYGHLTMGKRREDLAYTDIDRHLIKAAFNEEGGFQNSKLIQKDLLTGLIPFLPLQAEHVRDCIADAAERRNVTNSEDLADFVLGELEWNPPDTRFFSTSGCKRVYEKVRLFAQLH